MAVSRQIPDLHGPRVADEADGDDEGSGVDAPFSREQLPYLFSGTGNGSAAALTSRLVPRASCAVIPGLQVRPGCPVNKETAFPTVPRIWSKVEPKRWSND